MAPHSRPVVKGYIILTFAFRKEGRVWTGTCLELGTSTYGRSFEKLKKELAELVEVHLNTLEDVGERERFFAENGIVFHSTGNPPKHFPVPLDEDAVYQPHLIEWPDAA